MGADAGPPADTRPPADAALAASAAALGRALAAADAMLAVAESCTGGWVAKVLTDVAGSSQWFERGYVTYSNEAKIEALGVRPATLEEHGAVSEAVVAEMAAGVRARSRAAAAIAISGIAGPGGAMPGKPVGLVWFGFELGERHWTVRADFPGDREAVRRAAVALALTTLLAALEE